MNLKFGLLPRVVIAIILGISGGFYLPVSIIRIFSTFNGLFGNFLSFFIPLLILGLVIAGIANLGSKAGRLLLYTVLIAYGFTLFSGFFTWSVCDLVYPWILKGEHLNVLTDKKLQEFPPYFTIGLKPFIDVLSALVLAFIMGLGISGLRGTTLKLAANEFEEIIQKVIQYIIIPCLPLFIFGIFLEMTAKGQVAMVLGIFIKLIIMIFFITIVMLFLQYGIAALLSWNNPFRLLKGMVPAYITALGTQSSAATIPVTLEQTIKNGVKPSLAKFVIPLCATIHLSGSTMKITACALAVMMMSGMPVSGSLITKFIFVLGITMVAAPGVPGGAIMAALGILQSVLGFSDENLALMIALYIAMDSFGTACNVTGDGAIAIILDSLLPQSDENTSLQK